MTWLAWYVSSDMRPKCLIEELVRDGERKFGAGFRRGVDEALARRRFGRWLARGRERGGLTQAQVAERMGSTQTVVSRLEHGVDARISTVQRYCAAVGVRLELPPR